MKIGYKKVPNNDNAIEIDGKVVLSFNPRYKEYLKWKEKNPDLEQQLLNDLKLEIKNKKLYNTGAPHKKGNIHSWYTEDGKLKMVAEMKGDVCHGQMIQYDENENIMVKEIFIDGEQHGNYVYYNEDGTKAVEGCMKNGKLDGQKTVFYDGNIHMVENFKNGKLHGKSEYYSFTGIKEYIGEYKNGKKHNKWYYYYETGDKERLEVYDMDEFIGEWKWWFPAGEKKKIEINIDNSVTEKKCVEYYINGAIRSSGNLKYGEMEGKWEFYFHNGKKELDCEFDFGSPIGIAKIWHDSGKLIGEVKCD